MTEEKLKKLCLKWQKLLRLEDWDIKVSFSKREELYDVESEADCNIDVEYKQVSINVVNEESRLKDNHGKIVDTENLLIHELLHIYVKCEHSIREMEIAINMITMALVKLDRKKKK